MNHFLLEVVATNNEIDDTLCSFSLPRLALRFAVAPRLRALIL
jgi:hypothetical protein